MLFNSYEFLFLFLPLALLACLPLRGRAVLRAITVCSFIFYAFAGHAWFLLPMAFTTGVDFILAQRLTPLPPESSRRKAILVLSLTLNLGLLGWFKYAGLFLGQGFATVVPAGISFYTFQTLAYMVDVYRGQAHAETDFWKFAGFVSFFPHLVAGPLTRHHQLIPALTRLEQEGIRPEWEGALFLFASGLVKKVLLGDALAAQVNPILDAGPAPGLGLAWASLLGYSLQIYFDFSGYSDMALGLGRLFGVRLPRNFDSPYRSPDPQQFWRRWHMTLSAFLRDYLYIGLGGNRKGELRREINLALTMFLGGLWHGAHWTFAAWGLYHGGLLALHRRVREAFARWPLALRSLLTFLAVTLGWVFFRSPDFAFAGAWFRGLAGGLGPGLPPEGLRGLLKMGGLLAVGLGWIWLLPEPAEHWDKGGVKAWQWSALGLLAAAAFCQLARSTRFIYFQF